MKHWKAEERDEVMMLTLDMAGKSANVLSTEVIRELHDIIYDIYAAQKSLKGLIICSGKRGGFILGANVEEFKDIDSAKEAEEFALYAQSIFNALEELSFPTVAAINGFCLGGGLELALACDYRIATDSDKTRLGLPEVLLGIHPGFAGTVRLPKLIGDIQALDMMLSGRTMHAKAARKIGLVDEVVPERYLMKASLEYIERRPIRKPLSWVKQIASWPAVRVLTAKMLRKKVSAKANPEHYPAPFRMIDLWLKYLRQQGDPQFIEAESLGEMLVSETSRNLVYLFLMREKLKKEAKNKRHSIKHVHVVGAGVMGADIAMWAASKGFTVSINDQSLEAIGNAVKRAHSFFKKKLKDPVKIREALDRFIPDPDRSFLHKADLVIEAVVENTEVKQSLFREVEKIVSPNALLATNTSGIPLEVIAEALEDPSRLVGIHFFNPVAKMELVEIIRGENTGEDELLRAKSFAVSLDKIPIEVSSSTGFLVNRILTPYLLEAVKLLNGGVSKENIDKSAVGFGMPMGPILLADTIGLDICLFVAQEMSELLGLEAPQILREMVAEKRLGKKTSRGFYEYGKNGKPKMGDQGEYNQAVADRLVSRMIREAEACLKDGIVADKDIVNIGAVFGTGFAPFKGGPFGRQ